MAKVKVTLVKSKYGRLKKHQACVAGLGLRRINHSVIVEDTPENFRTILDVASGRPSLSEAQGLGDNEFVPWQIGATM